MIQEVMKYVSLMLKILFVNVMRYLLFNFTMYVNVRIFVGKKVILIFDVAFHIEIFIF